MSERYAEQGAALMESRPAPFADQPRIRVLIVDDETAARRLCAGYCDLFDFTCAIARSAPEAAAALRREAFDVVLINVHMDDGGVADLAALRALPGRAPPMIGLTAIGRDDEAQRWLAAGLTGILPKPITAARLYAALDHRGRGYARPDPQLGHRRRAERLRLAQAAVACPPPAFGGSGGRWRRQQGLGPDRAGGEVAAAIGALAGERAIDAVGAKGAFEGADAGPVAGRRQVNVTAFAVGAQGEHGGLRGWMD